MRKALFAGSFNPLHKGHISIYNKASKLFDEVIIYVAVNPDKDNANSLEVRAQKVREQLPKANVIYGPGLTVDVAKKNKCDYLVRGIRNNTDVDYELDLAIKNNFLNKNIETIFILADEDLKDISSSSIGVKLK